MGDTLESAPPLGEFAPPMRDSLTDLRPLAKQLHPLDLHPLPSEASKKEKSGP